MENDVLRFGNGQSVWKFDVTTDQHLAPFCSPQNRQWHQWHIAWAAPLCHGIGWHHCHLVIAFPGGPRFSQLIHGSCHPKKRTVSRIVNLLFWLVFSFAIPFLCIICVCGIDVCEIFVNSYFHALLFSFAEIFTYLYFSFKTGPPSQNIITVVCMLLLSSAI